MDATLGVLGLLPLVAVGALWRAGVFADPHRSAWANISGTRAVLRSDRGRGRGRAIHWLATRLDLELQLKRAGLRQTPARFIVAGTVWGATVLGALLLVDGIFLAGAYEAPIPPLAALAAGVATTVARVAALPRQARRRRRTIDDSLTEIMVPLAIVSAGGAIANRKEALVLFATALDDPTLRRFIQIPEAFGETRDALAVDYRALVRDPGNIDDVTLFRAIGEMYGSELFLALSQAEYQVKRQRPLREALRGIADQFLGRQIDEDEQSVDLARTKVNVPMSAFILLVFTAILVPTAFIIVHAIGG